MTPTNFDEIAEDYNSILTKQLNFFEKDNAYFAEYKVATLKNLLKVPPTSILDFGCGIGRSSVFLQKYFPDARIAGCDTSQKSLGYAKKQLPSADFFTTDDLITKPKAFDVIFVSNVFHHIPPLMRADIMAMIVHAATSSATIVVFEHNPYNLVTRYLVHTCPFDADAVLLAPAELNALFKQAGIQSVKSSYTLFFPAFLKQLRFLEKYLGFLPLGGQYVVSGHL